MVKTTHKKIGTYFKKENIFLATVSATEKNIQLGLDEKFKEDIYFMCCRFGYRLLFYR